MTSTTDHDGAEVAIDGFAPWLPLPLDGDHDSFIALVDEQFAADPASVELRRASAAVLADVGDQISATADDGYLPIAAWAYLAEEGRHLDPLSLLTFGATRTAPGSTRTDVVERMCSEVDLYQPPALEDIDSRSGPATIARLRRYTGEHPDTEITEIIAVIWMSSTLDLAYVMSTTPIGDLILAAEIADAIAPLAASVSGL